jgi:hypothetical protein
MVAFGRPGSCSGVERTHQCRRSAVLSENPQSDVIAARTFADD